MATKKVGEIEKASKEVMKGDHKQGRKCPDTGSESGDEQHLVDSESDDEPMEIIWDEKAIQEGFEQEEAWQTRIRIADERRAEEQGKIIDAHNDVGLRKLSRPSPEGGRKARRLDEMQKQE